MYKPSQNRVRHRHPRRKAPKLYDSPLYKEGSEACRNYSRLTMQVRTLAQHVLIGYVIAISVAILSGKLRPGSGSGGAVQGADLMGFVLLYAGIVLGSFSVSLALVDWHYQSAFTAIRDALTEMEGDVCGPWNAHKYIRTVPNDFIASYVPFWVLWGIGIASFVYGVSMVGSISAVTMTIASVTFIAGLISFVYIGSHQGHDAVRNFHQRSS